MTRQQQEAYDKFLKALELQEQGIPRQEIYKHEDVAYSSIDTLTKLMRKNGYKYSDEEQKYIQVTPSNTEDTTSSISESSVRTTTPNTTSDNIPNTTQTTTPSNAEIRAIEPQHGEMLNVLLEEKETLSELLSWFKKYRVLTQTDILVELPVCENTQISCRANKIIWEQFGVFAEQHKATFNKADLMSQALKEFIEKYNQ